MTVFLAVHTLLVLVANYTGLDYGQLIAVASYHLWDAMFTSSWTSSPGSNPIAISSFLLFANILHYGQNHAGKQSHAVSRCVGYQFQATVWEKADVVNFHRTRPAVHRVACTLRYTSGEHMAKTVIHIHPISRIYWYIFSFPFNPLMDSDQSTERTKHL